MTDTPETNLVSFAGAPYSEAHNAQTAMLDTSAAEAELHRQNLLREEAAEVWNRGAALEYICSSCEKVHVGDKTAIKCMILSYASTRVINGEGIHISISGSAGTGKSHAAATAADHLPRGTVMDARLSDKALYYHEIKSGTVLLMDDQELSEDFQELLKVASTDWSKPAKYLTVNNQKSMTLSLPAQCPFWIVKANLNGDEQVLDRQLVIWTDESTEQRLAIQAQILRQAANPELQEDNHDLTVSREIWNNIPKSIVRIPYAEQIRCDEFMDPRNMKLLIALIQSIALMHSPLRETAVEDSAGGTKTIVTADISDFVDAANLINPLLGNRGGSQKLKLSSSAAKVLEFLSQKPTGLYSFEEIMADLGISKWALSVALNGRKDRETMEGLLKVCPAIEIVTDTVQKQKGCGSFTRKCVQWNAYSYKAWNASAGMFYLG